MNLLIDIGNTSCKLAFSEENTIGKILRYSGNDISDFIVKTIKKETPYIKPDVAVLSNVCADDKDLEEVIKKKCRKLVVINQATIDELDYEILSNMPEGMGADRVAAILAANTLFPDKDLMVFDFGTATTVEFIDGHKINKETGKDIAAKYLGGSISLGLNTRYKALSHFTQRIPLLNPNDFLEKHKSQDISPIGMDIDTAMAAGNILGIMFEIQGYMALNPDRTVIFTGGDAFYFAERLKKSIFVVYNLVLMGLSQIAQRYTETENV